MNDEFAIIEIVNNDYYFLMAGTEETIDHTIYVYTELANEASDGQSQVVKLDLSQYNLEDLVNHTISLQELNIGY